MHDLFKRGTPARFYGRAMSDLGVLGATLDGELLTPGVAGYDDVRRPRNVAFADVRPRAIVLCRSERDAVAAVRYAARSGLRLAPRGGGHCFAGRSSTDGMVLDLSALSGIDVRSDGTASIGAGARLGQVYRALCAHGRTLPGGCGAGVGIAGLTLGGGIGLLGRSAGLTSDRLVGARVVLADGAVVDCDAEREPDLFWALRGAGGGQFGVVTSFRFATIAEPDTVRVDARPHVLDLDAAAGLIGAWQRWAPGAPDALTVCLTVEGASGGPGVLVRVSGASTLPVAHTRELLDGFAATVSVPIELRLSGPMPFSALKDTLADDARSADGQPLRIRSEFFDGELGEGTLVRLVTALTAIATATSTAERGSGTRRLTFTPMGPGYDRVAEHETAFAHRGQRFLLEHAAAPGDDWVDVSWTTAHPDASGRVYPNFPDTALTDPVAAYHAGNAARLAEVKRHYDPHGFFRFPQAIDPGTTKHDTNEVRS